MIPLKTSEPVQRFPKFSVVLVLTWLAADVVSRLWPGARVDFLSHFWFMPASPGRGALASWLFHTNVFSLCVTLLFAWVFSPRLFERRGVALSLVTGLSGVAVALVSYRALHPTSTAPVLAAEAFLGALIGAFMRKDIWGSVNTLVIGPGWMRVYEVPSYVLLFFWLFYLLVGNLLTHPPFSDAPLWYWIPFISFLWGFVLETLWDILGRWTLSSSRGVKSAGKKS